MPHIVAGVFKMKAKEFNALYPKGSSFIYQPQVYAVAV